MGRLQPAEGYLLQQDFGSSTLTFEPWLPHLIMAFGDTTNVHSVLVACGSHSADGLGGSVKRDWIYFHFLKVKSCGRCGWLPACAMSSSVPGSREMKRSQTVAGVG